MAELCPSDAELNALSGTSDAEQELLAVTTFESPYYTSFYKFYHRLLLMARRAGDLRVYKDAALTFGVRAGKYLNGDTLVEYAGAAAQALTNNQTNYIYLTAAGVLTVNTTGFPVPSVTPHVRLATILTAGGVYAYTAITDMRDTALFAPACGILELAPRLSLSGTDDTDGTGSMDIQVVDAAGNNLAQRFLARVWIADAAYSEPDAQTDFSVATGEEMRELEADADYEVISDATGLISMDIDAGGAKTVHVMAAIDGRIWTASVAITGP